MILKEAIQIALISNLDKAICLSDQLNDVLYNLSIDIDEDDITPEIREKIDFLCKLFKITPVSKGILDHVEALKEIANPES
jgi:hypothetical protein